MGHKTEASEHYHTHTEQSKVQHVKGGNEFFFCVGAFDNQG